MAINYSVAAKTDRMGILNTRLGAGSLLVIGTSALSGATGVLASIPMAATPFTVSNPSGTTVQAALAGVPISANASAGGTAAKAELRTSAGVVVATGLTVGTSGTDIIINSTTITNGQLVEVTTGTITHAA